MFGVSEHAECSGYGLVNDFEVSAAFQFFEFDEGEVGFDAGGVAVHEESDGSGGCDASGLCVAESVFFAEFEDFVPEFAGGVDEVFGEVLVVEDDGWSVYVFDVLGFTVHACAVVLDYAEHAIFVSVVGGEGSEGFGEFGAGFVDHTGHECGDGGGELSAFFAVVGDACAHEECAQVGVSQSECSVFPGAFRDAFVGVLCHADGDVQDDGPESAGVEEVFYAELSLLFIPEFDEVEASEVAGGVVDEHVFGAGVRGSDGFVVAAGMPVVDGGVELESGVGACPGGACDFVPEFACGDGCHDFACGSCGEFPVAVFFKECEESFRESHGDVGVLSPDAFQDFF